MPAAYQGGAIIGQHGSWNRNPVNGYQVLFVPFANGKPAGKPQLMLSGFLNAKGQAQGRPVGVAVDQAGAVLVADADPYITVTVVGDKKVRVGDEELSLSAATQQVLHLEYAIRPAPAWRYQGRLLSELYEETYTTIE